MPDVKLYTYHVLRSRTDPKVLVVSSDEDMMNRYISKTYPNGLPDHLKIYTYMTSESNVVYHRGHTLNYLKDTDEFIFY